MTGHTIHERHCEKSRRLKASVCIIVSCAAITSVARLYCYLPLQLASFVSSTPCSHHHSFIHIDSAHRVVALSLTQPNYRTIYFPSFSLTLSPNPFFPPSSSPPPTSPSFPTLACPLPILPLPVPPPLIGFVASSCFFIKGSLF